MFSTPPHPTPPTVAEQGNRTECTKPRIGGLLLVFDEDKIVICESYSFWFSSSAHILYSRCVCALLF